MKILHTVQRYWPEVGGSEEAVKQISERLSRLGHEVTVVTGASSRPAEEVVNGVRVVRFSCSGSAVEGLQGSIEGYRNFLASGDWDIIMNYAAQIWSTDVMFDLLPSQRAKTVFVPCGYSRLYDPRYADYFRRMEEVLRLYDRVVYLSDDYVDRGFADRLGLRNGVLIPNGADRTEFDAATQGHIRSHYGFEGRLLLLNVSNHSTLKGHDFFWSCFSQLDRRRVAGLLYGNSYARWPKKYLSQCYSLCRLHGLRYGVPVVEEAPRLDVVNAYVDADIFLFGSLVECSPLVMFESFASKTLFVTKEVGNVKDYKDIVCIVKNEEEALRIIRDYAEHPDRYRPRIDEGYRLFRESLNWEAVAVKYEDLYVEILASENCR